MSTEIQSLGGTALAPVESEVSGLVRLAIEEKVPVEVLERIVALQELVTERNARTAFFAAVAGFQAECPPLTRGKVVDYTTKTGARIKYNFAPLDEIAKTVRPFLAKFGLSYSWNSAVSDGQLEVVCALHHVEGFSRSASFRCSIEGAGSSTMNGPQKAGSATSYGQRYSLIQVLGLTSADEDKDGAHGNESDTETITAVQAADLVALVDEVGVNRAKVLAWLKVDSFEDIRQSDYPRAVAAMEAKRSA